VTRLTAKIKLANVTTTNKSVVPKKGRVIVACNHPSVMDPLYLWSALPRNATAVAKAELWRMPGVNFLLWLLGHIPIKRGNVESAKRTVAAAINILEHEGIVLIFPEGKCSIDGTLLPLKRGIADMAMATRSPIIPVGIIGSNNVLPPDKRFPRLRRPVQLNFGEPIVTDGLTKDEILAATTEQISLLMQKPTHVPA
jgi:1-acyl-sn-glycerol-3-phosphate acyltransferase